MPEPQSHSSQFCLGGGQVPAEGDSLTGRAPADYKVDPETGCWEWQRYKLKGYGRSSAHGLSQYAHRAYYEAMHGAVPEGYHVHHKCENPGCVNPEHLEATTATNHFLEHKLHAKTGLTLDDIREIRRLSTVPGVTAPRLAERYGVHEITIYDYWSSNHWAEILGGEHAGRPVRTCVECGEEFSERRRNAKFCCAEHRRRWNSRRTWRRANWGDPDATEKAA